MCVDYNQVDRLGNQTPPPTFRPHLPLTIYQVMKEVEQEIQFEGRGKPHTPVPAPAPVPTATPAPTPTPMQACPAARPATGSAWPVPD